MGHSRLCNGHWSSYWVVIVEPAICMTPFLCLAAAIYFEAGNQSVEGKQAVADVILTRVASARFPNTICDVVFQSKQFSFTHDGLPDDIDAITNVLDVAMVNEAKAVASHSMDNYTPGLHSDHYHTIAVNPYWNANMQFVTVVGYHIFYISR